MKQTLGCMLLLATALVGGCGKPKAAATTQPNTNTASADVAGADSTPQGPLHGSELQPATAASPVLIPDTGDTSATLSRLSLELRRYVLRTRTAPKSFEDFLAQSQIQAPPPPAGKKYLLQSGAVVLANR
jgi:hypothetical protein